MHILFKTIPLLSMRLSGSSFLVAVKICFQLWHFALTRKLFNYKADFPVTVFFNSVEFTLHLRYVMDLAVLREIYIEKEYEWFPVENPKVIIDLGAHFGDTALYYSARFPEAKIIAVEPSPENFERLVEHSKNFTNIIPVQAAVGESDGEIELDIGGAQFGHSIVSRENSESKRITVAQKSLRSLLDQFGTERADMVKFDIEGSEFKMFTNDSPQSISKNYIGEVHLDLSHGDSLEGFVNIFSEFDVTSHVVSAGRRYIVAAKYRGYE